MKKGMDFEWDMQCQNALQNIKIYLTRPPLLASPTKGKPLILSITALEQSLGPLLAQENEKNKENALCYLSPTLIGPEERCINLMLAGHVDESTHDTCKPISK